MLPSAVFEVIILVLLVFTVDISTDYEIFTYITCSAIYTSVQQCRFAIRMSSSIVHSIPTNNLKPQATIMLPGDNVNFKWACNAKCWIT